MQFFNSKISWGKGNEYIYRTSHMNNEDHSVRENELQA